MPGQLFVLTTTITIGWIILSINILSNTTMIRLELREIKLAIKQGALDHGSPRD